MPETLGGELAAVAGEGAFEPSELVPDPAADADARQRAGGRDHRAGPEHARLTVAAATGPRLGRWIRDGGAWPGCTVTAPSDHGDRAVSCT